MSLISMIVAMDEKRGIGKNNQLLCHLPADLKYFKQQTLGKPIIMGYHTYQSIGKPLPGRHNIVLSRRHRDIKGVTVACCVEEAIQMAEPAPEIMIIGGSSIFEQTLPLVQRIYLTLIHHEFVADVYFPELDEKKWSVREVLIHPLDEKNSYNMTFYIYSSSSNPPN